MEIVLETKAPTPNQGGVKVMIVISKPDSNDQEFDRECAKYMYGYITKLVAGHVAGTQITLSSDPEGTIRCTDTFKNFLVTATKEISKMSLDRMAEIMEGINPQKNDDFLVMYS